MSLTPKTRPWSEWEKRELTRLLLVEGHSYEYAARHLRRPKQDCIDAAGEIPAKHYLAQLRQTVPTGRPGE